MNFMTCQKNHICLYYLMFLDISIALVVWRDATHVEYVGILATLDLDIAISKYLQDFVGSFEFRRG